VAQKCVSVPLAPLWCLPRFSLFFFCSGLGSGLVGFRAAGGSAERGQKHGAPLLAFESVSLPRPPTFSTFQSLDMLSRIAKGATLLALHSQQGPASSCAPLDAALATLEAHPRVALVGFQAEQLGEGLAGAEEALKTSTAFRPKYRPQGDSPGLGFSFATSFRVSPGAAGLRAAHHWGY